MLACHLRTIAVLGLFADSGAWVIGGFRPLQSRGGLRPLAAGRWDPPPPSAPPPPPQSDAESTAASAAVDPKTAEVGPGGLDPELWGDERFQRVMLPRGTGIQFASGLSFSWIYVAALAPLGAAELSGRVAVGDQLCGVNGVSMLGEGFSEVRS